MALSDTKQMEEMLIRQMLLDVKNMDVFYPHGYNDKLRDHIAYIPGMEKSIKSPKDFPFFISELINMLLYTLTQNASYYNSLNEMYFFTARLLFLRQQYERMVIDDGKLDDSANEE